jgi:hypothetical protein
LSLLIPLIIGAAITVLVGLISSESLACEQRHHERQYETNYPIAAILAHIRPA